MPKTNVFKVIVSGEGGVGKTTLLHRYVDGVFKADTRLTIGVEFQLKTIVVNGVQVILQIWDLGGQERFRFLLKNYVKGSKGAILMFDLTRPLTLVAIDNWIEICRDETPDLPILFLGSKADLADLIHLEESYILEFIEKYDFFDYLKVSSKTGLNVDRAFELLAKKIVIDQKK